MKGTPLQMKMITLAVLAMTIILDVTISVEGIDEYNEDGSARCYHLGRKLYGVDLDTLKYPVTHVDHMGRRYLVDVNQVEIVLNNANNANPAQSPSIHTKWFTHYLYLWNGTDHHQRLTCEWIEPQGKCCVWEDQVYVSEVPIFVDCIHNIETYTSYFRPSEASNKDNCSVSTHYLSGLGCSWVNLHDDSDSETGDGDSTGDGSSTIDQLGEQGVGDANFTTDNINNAQTGTDVDGISGDGAKEDKIDTAQIVVLSVIGAFLLVFICVIVRFLCLSTSCKKRQPPAETTDVEEIGEEAENAEVEAETEV